MLGEGAGGVNREKSEAMVTIEVVAMVVWQCNVVLLAAAAAAAEVVSIVLVAVIIDDNRVR